MTGGTSYEGQTVSQAHVRKMQGHPPQGPGHGDLPGSETQAETGLIHPAQSEIARQRDAAASDRYAGSGYSHIRVCR